MKNDKTKILQKRIFPLFPIQGMDNTADLLIKPDKQDSLAIERAFEILDVICMDNDQVFEDKSG